jgi:uncharacterized protein (DUF427 family)
MPDAPRGLVRVETSAKRVRTYFGGHLVADTMHPLLVWEVPYFPSYFLPVDDIRAELVATGETKHSPSRGDADVYDVHAGDAVAKAAALRYATSPIEQIRNTVKIDWRSMDEWLEEDEPVYTHPRDPYTRVDILASSRHVRVEIDGVTVADSHGPRILFETGLPPRYYLPLSDCAMERFVRSGSETHCPYKGQASYW